MAELQTTGFPGINSLFVDSLNDSMVRYCVL
jgi:hypothetical protein